MSEEIKNYIQNKEIPLQDRWNCLIENIELSDTLPHNLRVCPFLVDNKQLIKGNKYSVLELYEKGKKEIYAKYPQHSAYRCGLSVQEYKRRGGTYKGSEIKTNGLNRWFAERWTNQRGEVGYKCKSDDYRPNVRITKNTPTIFKELSKDEIKKARSEKAKSGHVAKFESK